MFISLHNHSHYSLLDGLPKIDDYIKKAQEYSMPALALTDHGTMYGVIEFYQKCVKAGIKPIIGCEMYMAPRDLHLKHAGIDEKTRHLILWAKNYEGYKNLIYLSTVAHLDGFYYRPRIDKKILRKKSNGLIATSACLNGEIPKALLNKKQETALALVKEYQEIFGPENFYLELEYIGEVAEQIEANQKLYELSKITGAPIIAARDTHYINDEDKIAQDVLLCVQIGKTLADQKRLNMTGADLSFIKPELMSEKFKDWPEAIANTEIVAEKCQLKLTLGQWQFPKVELPDNITAEQQLINITEAGFKNKFPETLNLTFHKYYDLRYGENPHQEACVYKDLNSRLRGNDSSGCNILNAKIIQGKRLSYNNIGDADGALATLKEFDKPACVVVKHANPCGVAVGDDITEVFKRAYNADALSAFGGIIALNKTCNKEIAEEIAKVFAEIVLAPDYEPEALKILAKKKNLRVLELGTITPLKPMLEFKHVSGGLLLQNTDIKIVNNEDIKVVTKKQPTETELSDMLFAWKVLKHIKSNGILIAKNNTTLGVGAGQVSRVDAVDMAIKKSADKISGSILASDAFFPFRDSIDKIAPTGIKAIIQPGGSIKDQEVIDACDNAGIAMVFTGERHFRH